jgi:hypothetical protein
MLYNIAAVQHQEKNTCSPVNGRPQELVYLNRSKGLMNINHEVPVLGYLNRKVICQACLQTNW